MDKVQLGKHRAFRTLWGLVEAVELEGIVGFNAVRCGGIWFLSYSVEV